MCQLEEDLQRAMTNLREIMDNLHPQTLDILGLGAALRVPSGASPSEDGLPEYHLYISPEAEVIDLSRLVRLTLYRIAIEAIHNVDQAQPGRAVTRSTWPGGETSSSCRWRTTASGSIRSRPPGTGGRGLNNIRERAKAIGARVAGEHPGSPPEPASSCILPLNGTQRTVKNAMEKHTIIIAEDNPKDFEFLEQLLAEWDQPCHRRAGP